MNQITLPLFEQFSTNDTLVCQTETETTHPQKTDDLFQGSGDSPTLLQYVRQIMKTYGARKLFDQSIPADVALQPSS